MLCAISLFSCLDILSSTRIVEPLKQFEEKKIFETPKPSQLIELLLSFVAGKNAVVLDSFAGSGTAAHAVLKLNNAIKAVAASFLWNLNPTQIG